MIPLTAAEPPDSSNFPMEGIADPDLLTLRAETYLCLSRAFLPPTGTGILDAMAGDLLADLEELHAAVPLPEPHRLAAMASALAATGSDEALLREYSRLFLMPPAPALLNLGFYLDGGIMGNSTLQMEAYYQRHGLQRDTAFRDLPDHVSLNLQFLAWVLSRSVELAETDPAASAQALVDARDLIVRFTLPGVHALLQKVREATDEGGPGAAYRELTETLARVLDRDFRFLHSLLPQPLEESVAAPAARPEPPSESPANGEPEAELSCRICGQPFLAGDALADMIARLQTAGLATDHLAVCPECRAETMGMRPLEPPTAKR